MRLKKLNGGRLTGRSDERRSDGGGSRLRCDPTGDGCRPADYASQEGSGVVFRGIPVGKHVDLQETEGSQDAAPDVALTRRSLWVWSSVVVGVLMLGFFAAWVGGVLKVKTPDGVIVLENVPKDSEILVDGEKITFAWPGVGKPLKIRKVPGQHKVEVKKDGFKTFGEVVTVKTDGSEEVTVRLERLDVDRTQKGDAGNPKVGEPPVPTAATHLIPPAGLLRRAEVGTGLVDR